MGSMGHNSGLRVLVVTPTRQGFVVSPEPPFASGATTTFDHPCAALAFAEGQVAAWPDRFAGYRDEVTV